MEKVLKKVIKNEKLLEFITIAQNRFAAANLSNSAVVVSYYLLLSLFPLLIALGNLLPFLKIDPNLALSYIKEIIPANVYGFIGPAIQDLLTNGSGELLSISALGTLWSASQGINALQQALNDAYGVEDRGNFLVNRVISAVFMAILISALVGVVLVVSLGEAVLSYLQPIFHFSTDIITIFAGLRWPVTLIGLLLMMVLMYRVLPNAKMTLKSTIPGTIFTSIGWLILGQFFGLYAQFFAQKISGYQIIGSFIVLMLWLDFAAMIVIGGGILNATFLEYRKKTDGKKKLEKAIAHAPGQPQKETTPTIGKPLPRFKLKKK